MTTILEAADCLLLSTRRKKTESLWRDDPCYKLIFSSSGGMRYQSARQDLTIQENEFILFNPHDEHRQLAADDCKFLIEIDPRLLQESAKAAGSEHREILFAQAPQKQPLIKQWVDLVNSFALQGESSTSTVLFLEHSFVQLCLLLVQTAAGTHSADLSYASFQAINPAVARVMHAIKADYQHPWSLDEMAAVLGISKFQFAHLFKQETGISPYSWLQLFRIVRSQELLLHSNRSITDIAASCGFSSTAVFNRLFKRLYGFPPAFFRKNYSNQIHD